MVYAYYHCDAHASNNPDEYDLCINNFEIIGHSIKDEYVTHIKTCACDDKKFNDIKIELSKQNEHLKLRFEDYITRHNICIIYNSTYLEKHNSFLFQKKYNKDKIKVEKIHDVYQSKTTLIDEKEFLNSINVGAIVDIYVEYWPEYTNIYRDEEDNVIMHIEQLLSKTGFFLRKIKTPLKRFDTVDIHIVDKYPDIKKAICKH